MPMSVGKTAIEARDNRQHAHSYAGSSDAGNASSGSVRRLMSPPETVARERDVACDDSSRKTGVREKEVERTVNDKDS